MAAERERERDIRRTMVNGAKPLRRSIAIQASRIVVHFALIPTSVAGAESHSARIVGRFCLPGRE